MSIRKSRRAVMAELLLMANPTSIHAHRDGSGLSVDFDSIAELRSWLDLAGLNSPDLLTREHDRTRDGRPYRVMCAYPTWHGWDIYATATDYTTAAPLDSTTADQLAALAVAR